MGHACPIQQNLMPDKTFKPTDRLLALYETAGVTQDKTVVTYCQTMHRAALACFREGTRGFIPDAWKSAILTQNTTVLEALSGTSQRRSV